MIIKKIAGLLLVGLLFNNKVPAQVKSIGALPHIIVYKTKKDYRNRVPVTLSADKKQVMSYPDQGDLKTGGASALPVLLHKGYLLDRQGVGIHSAFTQYTYKEYVLRKELPSPDEFMSRITDKDPMVAVYDCGVRRGQDTTITRLLNTWIDHKQLGQKCKLIK